MPLFFPTVGISRTSTSVISETYSTKINLGIRFSSMLPMHANRGYMLISRFRQFFSGPLKQFEKTETFTTIGGKKLTRLKNADIIEGEFSAIVMDMA
jgi:hypothetical protein